jgi:hypothetical protein
MRHCSFALTTLISFVPFALGCSSSYVPVASPRASIVLDSGSYAYVRDGKKYEGGLFGGELEEAVHGNPRAEAYARAYKTGTATGFALSMVGAAAAIAGLFVFGAQAAQTSNSSDIPPTGLLITGGGLLVDLVGGIVTLNAAPHMTDAINAYNDGLYSEPPSPPPVHVPTATTTTPTTPASEPARVESPNRSQTPAGSPGEVLRPAGGAAP